MIQAAMDIGTNSVRLLVGEITDNGVRTLYKNLCTTRLGEGVHHRGNLAAVAIERTITAIAEFAATAKSLGAAKIIAVATSAVRDAANGRQFVELCKAQTGINVTILAGEAEAQLSYAGATAGRDAAQNYLVVDIGGGSTEFAYGQNGRLQRTASVNLGAVRLSELFPSRPDGVVAELGAITAYIESHLARLEPLSQPVTLIGVGGTITSLAAIDQRLTVYDSSKVQDYYLYYTAVDKLLPELARTPLAVRQTLPGLQPQRADIIVYGTAILAAVLRHFAAAGVYVSEQDILAGLLIC